MGRTCNYCGISKPASEFRRQFDCKDGLHPQCLDCGRAAAAAANKARKDFIQGYLATHPCVDCGESDPVVLEFDHVRGVKIANVSRMATRRPLADIVAEIEKCDVRCANCHRRITYFRSH